MGVIGTGSSAIQSIPVIAGQAAELTVFQRTPNYSVPAWNGAISTELYADWDANRDDYRASVRGQAFAALTEAGERPAAAFSPAEQAAEFERRWQIGGLQRMSIFADVLVDTGANDVAANLMPGKIRSIVHDPETAEALVPKTYPIATKRMCVDTGHYATFNRPNVALVDLRATPIERITATGVRTSSGEYPLDALVLATGFDAMTGTLTRIDIRGRGGRSLGDKWSEGPRTYLGLMVAGFPNLFTVKGPGSPRC